MDGMRCHVSYISHPAGHQSLRLTPQQPCLPLFATRVPPNSKQHDRIMLLLLMYCTAHMLYCVNCTATYVLLLQYYIRTVVGLL